MHKALAVATAAVLLAACGGGDKGGTKPPPPTPVATVELSQQSATIKVGDILTLSAIAKASDGTVLTGRTAVWTSSNSSIAAVADGAISALTAGTATITVTIEQKSAQATIVVELPGISTVSVSAPRKGFVHVGSTSQLTVELRDASGSTLTGRTITYSSSDESKATVSSTGLVTGVAPGTVTITATSEGKTGTVAMTVTAIAEPSIAGITPATLVPGGTATITGTNFSTTPNENQVTVAGAQVTVTSASATQLTVQLPAVMPCVPTRAHPVEVLTGGGPAEIQHPVQVAAARTLGVGESLLLLDASARCNELVGGGSRYVMAVLNASTTPSARTGVELNGAAASVGAFPPLASFSASPLALRGGAGIPVAESPRVAALRSLMRSAQRAHMQRLERERQVLRAVVAARLSGRWRSSASRSAATGITRSTTTAAFNVGDIVPLNYPSRTSCGVPTPVNAKVVYVGTHAVVLEDVTGPLAGQLDADFRAFGQLFDNTMYPIEANFGNLEAYDAQLNNPGLVLMLFTPKVNAEGAGLLGFVTGCDFADPTESGFSASNKTKIFYARTALRLQPQNPDAFSFDDRPLWALTMPATVVHETKHIVSFAEHIARNASDFEDSWLEEATAQIASELYGRTVWSGAGWRTNATYQTPANTMYCEVRVVFAPTNFPQCNSYTWNVADNFFNLYDYYKDISNKSFLSTGRDDPTIYGSAWLFVRWLTDQYGGSDEGAFLRSIVQESSLFGIANVVAKTGRPFEELLANFMLALIADDYPAFTPAAGASYIIPSWNTRDMFAGMSRDFQDVDLFPLAIRTLNFGTFTVSVPPIAGASAAFFELSGTPPARQLVDLGDVVNTAPIRLAILRVQ